MKFIDEAIITVCSGNGGRGCVSFRRERFVPRGGPDGGDGGHGGSILFKTDPGKRTLYHFRSKKHFRAQNGAPGEGRQKTGKSGKDLVIEIPPGTIISDAETGEVLKDMVAPDQSVELLSGGRGGKGNRHFTSSTHRSPKFAQPGEPGQCITIRLELKLLADVGIIGLPNAGKSTLLSVISAAKPAINNYPFTTLSPMLGMVTLKDSEPIAVADIPGLIKGAHTGTGLGIQFLKHIERTRILLHLIDASTIDENDPLAGFHTINTELAMFSEALARKPQVAVLNKMDIPEAAPLARAFEDTARLGRCFSISAATKKGIPDLKKYLFEVLWDLEQRKA
ncbi:MAG: GTPase ObgE [Thermodesulfobacteriota bacterium]|nr:GTPase ObgE [Thermodesulfobacteriota bacterium]